MSVERVRLVSALAAVTGLVLIAAAWTARAQTTAPASLDEAVEHVRRMREEGASNRRIAWYVTSVVDRRMVNGNGAEGLFYRWVFPPLGVVYNSWAWRTHARFANERQAIDRTPGRGYADIARWAWDLEYGQCGEASAMTYYILREAGVPARMFEVPNRHAFTAIGVDEDADLSDPTTWGSDAWVVDGWVGAAVESRRMNDYAWLRARRVAHVTGGYDSPELHEASVRNEGLENLNVTVTAPDGSPVVGAGVTIEGAESRSLPTVRGGRAAFRRIAQGRYAVSVAPPAGSGLADGSAEVTVETLPRRAPNALAIRLEAAAQTPGPLTVRVFDAAGVPVPEATVTLSGGASGVTGADGQVGLEARAGAVEITAERAGLGAGHAGADLSPPFETYADVALSGELSALDAGAPGSADAGTSGDAGRSEDDARSRDGGARRPVARAQTPETGPEQPAEPEGRRGIELLAPERCTSGTCTGGAQPAPASAATQEQEWVVWLHPDHTTCCPGDHGGAPQYRYHGTRASGVRSGAIIVRRFGTEAEMRAWTCGRPVSYHYWARTYARMGEYHVTTLPCDPTR